MRMSPWATSVSVNLRRSAIGSPVRRHLDTSETPIYTATEAVQLGKTRLDESERPGICPTGEETYDAFEYRRSHVGCGHGFDHFEYSQGSDLGRAANAELST